MIEKTTFNTNGERLDIGVMFTKIDKVNRIVSGFATLNNRDSHGDEISEHGTKKAFSKFRGGIREMHQPNAVGSLIKFEEIRKYDPEDDQVYAGMYVHARVSEGAEDTWKKVLDGTLKGFSIGGSARKKFKKQDPETGEEWNVIDEYDLHEISLVDNPANPLATVLTVKKVGDEYVYADDEAMEKQIMHILIQDDSGDVILSEEGDRDGFTNIGWTDSVDNTEKIRRAIDDYHASTEDSEKVAKSEDFGEGTGWSLSGNTATFTSEAINGKVFLLNEGDQVILRGVDNTSEGGATVAKKTKKDAEVEEQDVTKSAENDDVNDDAVEQDDVEKSADETDDDTEDEDVEKAADVDEVEDESSDNTDADDIVSKVVAALSGEFEKATTAAQESKDAIEETKSSFEKKISDLESSLRKELDGLNERVEEAESTTAVKKSADVVDDDDAEEDDEEESFWRGSGFLSVSDLVKG